MEPHELAAAGGQKCPNKEPVREKVPLQRKWVSEPSAASKRSTFADPAKRHSHRESMQCGGPLAQQKYAPTGNSGKLLLGPSALGAVGGGPPPSQDPGPGSFAQGFPRGYPYQLGQPYPQHPQTERFLSGAKPQPGLEPHAWPFAGQLPSDDLYPTGHSAGHAGHPDRRFRQKSPSLPSSFGGQYGQEDAEGYGKKEQKPKKPGKYICHYCGRACAKPSVLKKHIRSHTGERPYPCVPCGFSFKTKSNLYKHRKSHAHAIKAGLVPFSELSASARAGGDLDQASSVGEAEVHSDGEQSTDTDEEGAVEGSTMLAGKASPIPQISFEADKSTGGAEPAYADSAEELTMGSMKVPILIVPKPGGVPSPTGMECPPFPDMKGPPHHHHMPGSQAGSRAGAAHHHPAPDDSPTIKQRLALRLTEKKSQDSIDPCGESQSLNLLSPHSKGSTDSGYFSRSESAEQQISPPNANVKSYEEIMFGRTWYSQHPLSRPNTRSRQSVTVGSVTASFAGLKPSGHAVLDMGKIAEDRVFFRGDGGSDPKQYPTPYPTGPCQSSTGLLEPPSDSGPLVRSNSMPTASPTNLNVPPGIRVSHSFDEMMTSDDVFYPGAGRRGLRRQAAFEHSAHGEAGEAEAYGHVPKSVVSSAGLKMGERSPGIPEHAAYSPYGTKVGMSEISNRKRRKEKSVGDEEDSPGHCDSSCSGSVEMMGDYECRPGSMDSSRATPTGKGSLYSAHSQSDSFDTCTSMCSEDMAFPPDADGGRKQGQAGGNVISVIQHTNSLSRPNSFEKSESFEQALGYQTPVERALSSQYSEQSDTDIYEDALSPEGTPMRTESAEQQAGQSDSDLASMGSCPSPGQPYHMNPHKLVRQPNIQVPEIRVTTEEPDRPDKEADASMSKEPEKQQQQQQQQQHVVVEEFQLPQRSDTLSQMPSEKLPPKKKRLRLADMEHSSGESSFESTCTSLSRSPSQESNLSHSSSFSMSFERDEALKSISPTKQDESCGGAKQSEFLTVPGSGHSGHHQQREMRRSSSEQAPCVLPSEPPEIRSKSFDYGSLSPSSRQGELYCSASAMKERRRGYLVRQASLSVYPETVVQEAGGGAELAIKQESSEHGLWSDRPTGPDLTSRTKRVVGSGGLGCHQQHHQHQHLLQHSISEDSLQDEPLCQRSQHRLQAQGSSSEGEYPGQEAVSYQQQPGLLWNQTDPHHRPRQHLSFQAQQQQQFQKLHHARSPGGSNSSSMAAHTLHKQQQAQPPHALQQHLHEPQPGDGKPEPLPYPAAFPPRASPHSQHQPQPFGSLSTTTTTTTTTTSTLLQHIHPAFATQAASLPGGGALVPVRIQTHVPSFGSAMYTSVSQLIASRGAASPCPAAGGGKAVGSSGFNLAHFLAQHEGAAAVAAALLRCPPWKPPDADTLPPAGQRLNTGIPLSLTSSTIATTDASGSGAGGSSSSKRMLSPASSLELFVETKQQKRVKEERMYGQIVKEMSAVELSGAATEAGGGDEASGRRLKSSESMEDADRMSSSPSPPPKIAVPVRSCAPHLPDVPPAESFTPPLQIVTDSSAAEKDGRESPEELDVDAPSPQSMLSSDNNNNNGEDDSQSDKSPRIPISMLVQLAANQSAGAELQQLFRFPSLRTATSVSWCFLSYTKPNDAESGSRAASVYASWSVSSYNPNPLGLSTKASLALLRSRQRAYTETTYAVAAMSPPSSGKLVSSVAWRLRFDQLKPELMPVDVSKLGRKMKGVVSRERSKEEQGEKEASSKQTPAEPTRIKIFEGGYKSNEDYVYVRGRGRGKYICEECGIRCKKPSMLKKHIRTHTDVRPYVCKFCNFAFKTKGNLTKHMKSKAHMKKCLELGVSVSSVDDIEADDVDVGEEGQRACGKALGGSAMADHQFSDADDSDGGEEDEGGDDVDDDDDDEDDYNDGDSTPRTRSRSTSPQPYGLPSMSVTSVAASHYQPSHHLLHHHHRSNTDLLGTNNRPQLFGYFTTVPSIQITTQGADREAECQQGAPVSGSSMDEDLPVPSPDQSSSLSPSSRLSSPGLDPASCPSPLSPGSSPSSRRYLSPHRDLSPRGGRRLSPRRDISPLRHISPKRELGLGAGGGGGGGGGFHRRDLSPRRELGLLAALSPHAAGAAARPASPGGTARDYKRDLSPGRGRHRGMIRALSPRRPLSPRRGGLHHHQHQSHQAPLPLGSVWSLRQGYQAQGSAWSLRQGYQAQGHTVTQGELAPLGPQRRASTDMETEQRAGSPSSGGQAGGQANLSGSSPRPVLFSHLPLHSQLQVRSPFPMIPIGGIQMVHSVPMSVTSGHAYSASGHAPSPQQQQQHRLALQKSTSEESNGNDVIVSSSPAERGGGERPARDSSQETTAGPPPGSGREEECIRTCTDAIASLCIDSSSSPRPAPSPPQGPGVQQHFRSPHPSPPDPHGPPSLPSSPCSGPIISTGASTDTQPQSPPPPPPPPPPPAISKPPLRGPKSGAAAS